jgi:DNA repair exonuclease SbcCD ATPase subunit
MPMFVDRLTVTAGFLENAHIDLAEGLTCIIGARGTCKSTIVETIRFAFDRDPKRVADLLGVSTNSASHGFGLIRGTLTGTAKITAHVTQGAEAQALTIERDAVPTSPRVYRDGVVATEDKPPFIEIYSQGELQSIAGEPQRRLELVDRRIRTTILSLREERAQLAAKLEQIGNSLRNQQASIEMLSSQVQALPSFRQQLKEMVARRPQLASDLQSEHQKATLREQTLDTSRRLVDHFSKIADELDAVGSRSGLSQEWVAPLLTSDLAAARDLHEALATFSEQVQSQKSIGQIAKAAFQEALTKMTQSAADLSGPYIRMRKEREAVNDSLKMEGRLTEEIRKLEGIQSQFEAAVKQRAATLAERANVRAKISTFSDRIFSLRSDEILQINEANYLRVILTLRQGGHSSEFIKVLNNMLEGSRLRNQIDVAGAIARSLAPSQLIDVIEGRDAVRLANLLGKDQSQANRLISFLADLPDLYRLEAILFEDELEITLFDKGVPKPLSQLSKGQMATALLPLILREAEYPLIIDQPEDDLDNRFIFEQLVETIRALKKKRQLIFITHNANIPVLGDADRVIVMRMASSTRADQPATGTLEQSTAEILALLEGGAQAFRSRSQRYGELLT